MSENELPICPNCENANHVVLIRTATKAGTAIGGTIGIGSTVVAGTFTALGSVVPGIGNVAGGLLGSALAGFLTGAAVGSKCGEYIDSAIGEYRCNKCGTEFEI